MRSTDVLRYTVLIAAGALVVAGSALGSTSPAQAHNYLVASSPSAGETLTELPEAFFVTTNESLLTVNGSVAGFAFQIVDAEGLHYETGCVEVEGPTMSTEPRLGAAGDYRALWQIVSADGHTVSSEIAFTWAPDAGAPVAEGSAAAPSCGGDPTTMTGEPSPPPTVSRPAAVPLGDVLWIGGGVLAVGIAVAVTILVLSRRR
ncbi:MAG: copper resistance protein CopC [Microbacteriaceae bacterium]